MIATTLVWSVVFACYKSHRDRRESELNETAVSLISEREKSLGVLKTALELDGQRAAGLSDQLKIIKEELKTVRNELDREREARQGAEAALKKEKNLVEVLQQQLFSGNTSVASTAQRPLGQAYDFGGTGTKMWTD